MGSTHCSDNWLTGIRSPCVTEWDSLKGGLIMNKGSEWKTIVIGNDCCTHLVSGLRPGVQMRRKKKPHLEKLCTLLCLGSRTGIIVMAALGSLVMQQDGNDFCRFLFIAMGASFFLQLTTPPTHSSVSIPTGYITRLFRSHNQIERFCVFLLTVSLTRVTRLKRQT